MQLHLNQLGRHLERELKTCYLVMGDEPLLKQETVTRIADRAAQAGFEERLRLSIEPGFDWPALLAQALQPSLFAERRHLILAMPDKLDDAARKALPELAASPDLLLILHGPRLDKRQQQSAWFKKLAGNGVFIPIWPPRRDELPRWFGQRLQQQGLSAEPDALDTLAELFEGNLLAAKQLVDQLGLLYPGQRLNRHQVQQIAADQAQLDVFQWLDALLAGDTRRALRALTSMAQQGIEAPLPLALLARELGRLHQLACAPAQPTPQQMEKLQIWKARQSLVRHALARLDARRLQQALCACSQAELAVKSNRVPQPFMLLEQLTVGLCEPGRTQALWQ